MSVLAVEWSAGVEDARADVASSMPTSLRVAPASVTGLVPAILAVAAGPPVIGTARQQAARAGDRVRERAAQRTHRARAAAGAPQSHGSTGAGSASS